MLRILNYFFISIQRVLHELRSDPTLWEAFQKQVQAFIDSQRKVILFAFIQFITSDFL